MLSHVLLEHLLIGNKLPYHFLLQNSVFFSHFLVRPWLIILITATVLSSPASIQVFCSILSMIYSLECQHSIVQWSGIPWTQSISIKCFRHRAFSSLHFGKCGSLLFSKSFLLYNPDFIILIFLYSKFRLLSLLFRDSFIYVDDILPENLNQYCVRCEQNCCGHARINRLGRLPLLVIDYFCCE